MGAFFIFEGFMGLERTRKYCPCIGTGVVDEMQKKDGAWVR